MQKKSGQTRMRNLILQTALLDYLPPMSGLSAGAVACLRNFREKSHQEIMYIRFLCARMILVIVNTRTLMAGAKLTWVSRKLLK